MRRIIALLLSLCLCGTASEAFAAVLITFDETFAQVYDPTTGGNTSDIFNTGGTTAVATVPGYSSITTSIFNPTSMSGGFVQTRLGNQGGTVQGAVVTQFTTDANISYTAGGSYSNSDGYTHLYGYLFDFTASSFVFLSEQVSPSGPASFTLGGAAGSYYNSFSGSLTGTLLAGHAYQWYGQASSQAYVAADGGATPSGGVSLTLGAVPEQSSVLVWSVLALTMGGVCWWQRASSRRSGSA
jgi:hypothetical protein